MAERLHPNDGRKIARSLEVWRTTGRKHSDIVREKAAAKAAHECRFDCRAMWVHCDQPALDGRLDRRVDGP